MASALRLEFCFSAVTLRRPCPIFQQGLNDKPLPLQYYHISGGMQKTINGKK
jgi:hypothetical protein